MTDLRALPDAALVDALRGTPERHPDQAPIVVEMRKRGMLGETPSPLSKAQEGYLTHLIRKAGNEQALLDYWSARLGEGGGDFYKCVDALSDKKEVDDPESLCAWLHHEVSGYWPGQEDRGK